MLRDQIETHPAWGYISKLSNVERYYALTGQNASMFTQIFNCKLEEWAFTRLNEIPIEWAYISVTDPFRNIAFIMVAKPNDL